MSNYQLPSKRGQICRLVSPLPDDDPKELYLIIEDLDGFADNSMIYVVMLSDIQKNAEDPSAAPLRSVLKRDLAVIAENLQSLIESLNN